MGHRLFAFIPPLLIALLAGCGEDKDGAAPIGTPLSAEQVRADQQAVRGVFDRYFNAVKQRDGKAASAYVTQSTIDYYQTMLDACLDFGEERTKAMPLMDRLMVVMVRHRVDPERLRSMTGHDLFVMGVDRGWVGDDSMNRLVSGAYDFEIDVKSETAAISLVDSASGKVNKDIITLEREGGDWRLDLYTLMKKTQPVVRARIIEAEMTENQFILMVAGLNSDKPAEETVWQPVGR